MSRAIPFFVFFLCLWANCAFSANPVFIAEKIDINTAPLEELVKIVHIGKVRAEELISLRPFFSLDELTKVKGIGEKYLEDIKTQGLAWLDPQLIKKNKMPEKELPVNGEPLRETPKKETPKDPLVFLISLSQAFFSGAIIFALKKLA